MPLTFLTVWAYQAEQTRPDLISPLFPVEEVKHSSAARSLNTVYLHSNYKQQTSQGSFC